MTRVAVFQGSAISGDKTRNIAKIRAAAHAAGVFGANFLVLPELFLTGYNIGPSVEELAEARTGPSLAAIGVIAREARCAIAVGFPEAEGKRIFNAAALFDEQGRLIAIYRKIQLFGDLEASYFSPGDEYVVTFVGGLPVGLAICYDIEFPEFSRALRRRGAELVLVPTANMAPYWEVPKTLVRARALENGISVAYANYSGSEGTLHFTGLSGIAGPDGIDLARAGPKGEVLLVADIPTDVRSDTLSTQLSDLRQPPML